MQPWRCPSTATRNARFRALVPEAPGVEVKAELAAIEGSGQFGPVERPMGGYLSLPASF